MYHQKLCTKNSFGGVYLIDRQQREISEMTAGKVNSFGGARGTAVSWPTLELRHNLSQGPPNRCSGRPCSRVACPRARHGGKPPQGLTAVLHPNDLASQQQTARDKGAAGGWYAWFWAP